MAVRAQPEPHCAAGLLDNRLAKEIRHVGAGVLAQRQSRLHARLAITFEPGFRDIAPPVFNAIGGLDEIAVTPGTVKSQHAVDGVVHHDGLDAASEVGQHDDPELLFGDQADEAAVEPACCTSFRPR